MVDLSGTTDLRDFKSDSEKFDQCRFNVNSFLVSGEILNLSFRLPVLVISKLVGRK